MARVTHGGSITAADLRDTDVRDTANRGESVSGHVLTPGDVLTVVAGDSSFSTTGIHIVSGQTYYPTPDNDSRENVYGQSTSASLSAYASAGANGFWPNYTVDLVQWAVDQFVYAGGVADQATLAGATFDKTLRIVPAHWLGDPTQAHYVDASATAAAHQYVEDGGLARNTTLNALASQVIQTGGHAQDTTVNSGGLLIVSSGGSAVGAQIGSSGAEHVLTGGSAANVTVVSGGLLSASPGATLTDITVNSGGRLDLSKDTVIAAPIVFNGGTIDIVDLTGSDTPQYSFSSGNTITVTRGAESDSFVLNNVVDPTVLHVTMDTDGSTLISYDPPAPCYCPGTLIATNAGEIPVEALNIGDIVLTASGAKRPIRWIGRRAYDGTFARGNMNLIPVRLEKGSLGKGLPRRSLTVSPLHAIFIDGYLIPAQCLVNGMSICNGEIGERLEYIHIELESHDLLLAEGVAAESFVDDGSRCMFHNAGTFAELYPEIKSAAPVYCAPRLESGPALEHIRARLSTRTDHHPHMGLLPSPSAYQLTGWAVDTMAPAEPVALQILLDGKVIGVALADEASEVVIGDIPAYGFTFGLPRGITTGCGRFSLRTPLTSSAKLDVAA